MADPVPGDVKYEYSRMYIVVNPDPRLGPPTYRVSNPDGLAGPDGEGGITEIDGGTY